MKIRLEEHTIGELFEGYKDSAENGVLHTAVNLMSDPLFSVNLFTKKRSGMLLLKPL